MNYRVVKGGVPRAFQEDYFSREIYLVPSLEATEQVCAAVLRRKAEGFWDGDWQLGAKQGVQFGGCLG